MVLWFLGLSFLAVLVVFDSPALDYRLIMAGSVLPWLDFAWGPPWPLHSVFFPVAVMVAVMVVGWGKRLQQRRWLGLAIGLFVHLVLAATWTRRDIFWWPAFGFDTDERPPVAPWQLALVLELAGAVVIVGLFRHLGLADRARRRRFATSGRLERASRVR